MDKQYRTLVRGDRKLPGYELRYRQGPSTYPNGVDAWGAGCEPETAVITEKNDMEFVYRVPCSESVPPDGYEVVDKGRLPKGALKGDAWLYWWADIKWEAVGGSGQLFSDYAYAAPADELRELYAQTEAERSVVASTQWRMLADDEVLRDGDEWTSKGLPENWEPIPAYFAEDTPQMINWNNSGFHFRRRVESAEQSAAAPASHSTVNDLFSENVELRGTAERLRGRLAVSIRENAELRAEVERLAAENAELRRITGEAIVDRDAYKRERDLLRVDSESANRNWAEMVRQRDEARAEVERLRETLASIRSFVAGNE